MVDLPGPRSSVIKQTYTTLWTLFNSKKLYLCLLQQKSRDLQFTKADTCPIGAKALIHVNVFT